MIESALLEWMPVKCQIKCRVHHTHQLPMMDTHNRRRRIRQSIERVSQTSAYFQSHIFWCSVIIFVNWFIRPNCEFSLKNKTKKFTKKFRIRKWLNYPILIFVVVWIGPFIALYQFHCSINQRNTRKFCVCVRVQSKWTKRYRWVRRKIMMTISRNRSVVLMNWYFILAIKTGSVLV